MGRWMSCLRGLVGLSWWLNFEGGCGRCGWVMGELALRCSVLRQNRS